MAPFIGPVLHTALAAVSWTKGRLDLFAIGEDHGIWHKFQSGGVWSPPHSPWENLGKPATNFTSVPAANSHTVGKFDIWAVGGEGQAYHKWFDAKDGKFGPAQLTWEPQGGRFTGSLAAISRAPGKTDIVGLGQDKVMYHKEWNGKDYVPGITTWAAIGGKFKTEPCVTSRKKAFLDVFTVGDDGKAYYKAQENGVWFPSQKDWTSMGGRFISKLSAVSQCSNCLEVFGVGTDGAVYHKWWNGKVWAPSVDKSDWASLGGNFVMDVVAISKASGKIDVFGVGADRHAYMKSYDGKNWSPDWQGLGGTFTSALEVVSWADNRLDVFGVGEKRTMQHRFTEGNLGKWTPASGEWASIGGSHIYP